MIWPRNFEDRLKEWNRLRFDCVVEPNLQTALQDINQWWFAAPWTPYHLHWDDQDIWPDPWQLLQDNLFCSLARGLGIMYTVTLIDRPDLQTAQLIEHGADNLVVFAKEKYILNWEQDQIVNINLTPMQTQHCVGQQQIKQRIK